jgi:superfamily II DNA helicase RecQ
MDEVCCRRVLLLEYFGEKFPPEQCKKTCDNCEKNGSVSLTDFTPHARAIVYIVREIINENRNSKPTLLKLAKLYSGSKDKETQKFEKYPLQGYKAMQKDVNKLTQEEITKLNDLSIDDFKLNKDVAEKLLQTMVLKDYLKEESISTFDRYSADYITLGFFLYFYFVIL